VARARELGVETALAHGLRYLADVALGEGDLGQAAALLREYLGVAERLGMKSHVAEALRHSGYLARARGEARAAGRLFGAAEQMMEELGWSPAPIGHAEYDRHLRAARAELGEQAFEAAWAEGRAMTPEQAAAYALGEPLHTARVASRTERLGWGPPPQPPSA
jgi:hypothetical protein